MHFADPDRRAQICRLYKHGIFQRGFDLLAHFFGLFLPRAAQHGDVLHDGQAGVAEEALHHALVHAGSRAQHACADIGDVRKLQQALYGAVFAEGAVQNGEDDVHVNRIGRRVQFPRVRLKRH